MLEWGLGGELSLALANATLLASRSVENMLSPDEAAELEEVRPLLDKIEYIAVGTGTDGDLATSKLILAFSE